MARLAPKAAHGCARLATRRARPPGDAGNAAPVARGSGPARGVHAGSAEARHREDRRLQERSWNWPASAITAIRGLFENYRKTNLVTDAEVRAEYDKAVAANSGKEYKARHILVKTEAEAKKIIADLKKGGNFEEIA